MARENQTKITHLVVREEVKEEFNLLWNKVNKKRFGRRVRGDEIVRMMIGLVKPSDIEKLQESTLSNKDRLEREYRKYVNKHGVIDKDEYIGLLMSGKLKKRSGKGGGKGECP